MLLVIKKVVYAPTWCIFKKNENKDGDCDACVFAHVALKKVHAWTSSWVPWHVYISKQQTDSLNCCVLCVCVVHAVAVPWWSNQMLLQAKEPAMAIPKLNWSQGLPWLCVFNAIKWARIVWVGCVEIEGDQVEIECIDSHTFKWMIISGMHLRKVLIQNL